MPFKSKAQQRYMFSEHPRIAKRWSKQTKNMKHLPYKKAASEIAADILKEETEEAEGNPVTLEEVRGFLRKNTAPEDTELHQWAENKGVSPHAAEELIYQLAAQQVTGKLPEDNVEGGPEESKSASIARYVLNKVAEEAIPGGMAANKPDSKYDAKQLAMGIKVEKEHTPDPVKAKEIAKDHLEEFGDYYTHLGKMEEKLETHKEDTIRKTAKEIATSVLIKVATSDEPITDTERNVMRYLTGATGAAIRAPKGKKMDAFTSVAEGDLKGGLKGLGAGAGIGAGVGGAGALIAALIAKRPGLLKHLGVGAAAGGFLGGVAGRRIGKFRGTGRALEELQEQSQSWKEQ